MNTPNTPVWHMQQAASHFSEVVDRALSEGPQTVMRNGKPVVRVVAVHNETASTNDAQPDDFMVAWLSAPKIEGGLPLFPREAHLGRAPLFGES